MIEQGMWMVRGTPPNPDVAAKVRSVRECGCAVYVGMRLDTHEAATASLPCSPRHLDLIERFGVAFRASLMVPTDKTAVDVVDVILCGLDA